MKTVTIQGQDYAVYADVSDGDLYFNADVSPYGVAWRASDPDDKARGLVTGTRFIDAQSWKGSKTGGASQENAFPRTGLFYADEARTPVDPNTIPPEVETASIQLAGWFMEGTAAQNAANAASGTRRLKAGSVEIEYFRTFSASGIGGAGPSLPPFFLDLLGLWMEGGGDVATSGARAFGTCGKTAFRRTPNVTIPY